MRRVLQKIIDRTHDVHIFIEECYNLYCDGYSFVDNLGLCYGLAITDLQSNYDANTWEELGLNKQMELIDSFYPEVCNEAEKVLYWLDSKKIVLTGHDESFRGISYQDNRTEEEIKPTSYEVATQDKRKWWKFW